jgi:hypothetical protein
MTPGIFCWSTSMRNRGGRAWHRFIMAGLAISLILLSSPTIVAQQPSPSLEETVNWLTNAYNPPSVTSEWFPDGCNSCGQRIVSKLAITGCSATMTDTWWVRHPDGVVDNYVLATEITLGQLDPSRAFVRTNGARFRYWMDLATTGGQKFIKTTTTWPDRPSAVTSLSEGILSLPRDDDKSQRAGKAWIYAIELCGGKPSAF